MSETMKINNTEALLRFVHDVDGFHDALLHEAVLLHPGYVGEDGRMFGDAELPDARLIFQSQFRDILAVQIDLKRVSRFRFEPSYDFRLEGEIRPGEVILYLSGKHYADFCEIRAAEAEYRMLGREFLGKECKLIRQDVAAGLVQVSQD